MIFHLYNAIQEKNEEMDKIDTGINHITCRLDDKITELEILEGYNDKVRMELENEIAAFQQLHYNFVFHF